jgi:hypothetical protein
VLFGTNFSEDRRYRYTLERDVAPSCCAADRRVALFIGCNPSIANESKPDPTVTRETNFTKAWGYNVYLKGNVFALVEQDGAKFKRTYERNGIDFANRTWLAQLITAADIVVCVWGAMGAEVSEAECEAVRQMIPSAKRHLLRRTKHGHPQHPLYLPASLKPEPWPWSAA